MIPVSKRHPLRVTEDPEDCMSSRRIHLLALATLLVGAATAADDATKKDLARMEGRWQIVSGEEDGNPSPDNLIEQFRMDIKGDRITFSGIKPMIEKAEKLSFKLDASAMPRCIDFKVETGSL